MEVVFNDSVTGSRLLIARQWLSKDLADEALNDAVNFSWEQRQVMMYGRLVNQARDVLLVGDATVDEAGEITPVVSGYSYSGQHLPLYPWVPTSPSPGDSDDEFDTFANDPYYWPREICKVINETWETDFNSCLMNRYLTGNNHISYHSDDVRQLGTSKDGVAKVATVSLGASRTFRLRKKKETTGYAFTTTLNHGDLVLMDGAMQTYYDHAIIKETKITQPRYSFTYRSLSEL